MLNLLLLVNSNLCFRWLMYVWWCAASVILGVATIGFLFFPRNVAETLEDYSVSKNILIAGAEGTVNETFEFLIRVIGCFMLLAWAGFECVAMSCCEFKTLLTNYVMLDMYLLSAISGLIVFSRNWIFSFKVTEAFIICYSIFLGGLVLTGLDLMVFRLVRVKTASVPTKVSTRRTRQTSKLANRVVQKGAKKYKSRREMRR